MWPQWEDWVSLSAETLDEFTPLCFDYQVFHSVHPHCAGTERCQMCEILCDGIGNLEKTERSVARGEGISFHRIYESPFFFLRSKDAGILSTNIRVSIRILLHDIQRGCMSFTCWRNEFVHWYSWGKKEKCFSVISSCGRKETRFLIAQWHAGTAPTWTLQPLRRWLWDFIMLLPHWKINHRFLISLLHLLKNRLCRIILKPFEAPFTKRNVASL